MSAPRMSVGTQRTVTASPLAVPAHPPRSRAASGADSSSPRRTASKPSKFLASCAADEAAAPTATPSRRATNHECRRSGGATPTSARGRYLPPRLDLSPSTRPVHVNGRVRSGPASRTGSAAPRMGELERRPRSHHSGTATASTSQGSDRSRPTKPSDTHGASPRPRSSTRSFLHHSPPPTPPRRRSQTRQWPNRCLSGSRASSSASLSALAREGRPSGSSQVNLTNSQPVRKRRVSTTRGASNASHGSSVDGGVPSRKSSVDRGIPSRPSSVTGLPQRRGLPSLSRSSSAASAHMRPRGGTATSARASRAASSLSSWSPSSSRLQRGSKRSPSATPSREAFRTVPTHSLTLGRDAGAMPRQTPATNRLHPNVVARMRANGSTAARCFAREHVCSDSFHASARSSSYAGSSCVASPRSVRPAGEAGTSPVVNRPSLDGLVAITPAGCADDDAHSDYGDAAARSSAADGSVCVLVSGASVPGWSAMPVASQFPPYKDYPESTVGTLTHCPNPQQPMLDSTGAESSVPSGVVTPRAEAFRPGARGPSAGSAGSSRRQDVLPLRSRNADMYRVDVARDEDMRLVYEARYRVDPELTPTKRGLQASARRHLYESHVFDATLDVRERDEIGRSPGASGRGRNRSGRSGVDDSVAMAAIDELDAIGFGISSERHNQRVQQGRRRHVAASAAPPTFNSGDRSLVSQIASGESSIGLHVAQLEGSAGAMLQCSAAKATQQLLPPPRRSGSQGAGANRSTFKFADGVAVPLDADGRSVDENEPCRFQRRRAAKSCSAFLRGHLGHDLQPLSGRRGAGGVMNSELESTRTGIRTRERIDEHFAAQPDNELPALKRSSRVTQQILNNAASADSDILGVRSRRNEMQSTNRRANSALATAIRDTPRGVQAGDGLVCEPFGTVIDDAEPPRSAKPRTTSASAAHNCPFGVDEGLDVRGVPIARQAAVGGDALSSDILASDGSLSVMNSSAYHQRYAALSSGERRSGANRTEGDWGAAAGVASKHQCNTRASRGYRIVHSAVGSAEDSQRSDSREAPATRFRTRRDSSGIFDPPGETPALTPRSSRRRITEEPRSSFDFRQMAAPTPSPSKRTGGATAADAERFVTTSRQSYVDPFATSPGPDTVGGRSSLYRQYMAGSRLPAEASQRGHFHRSPQPHLDVLSWE